MEPQEQPRQHQNKINPFKESQQQQPAEKINSLKELPKPRQPQLDNKPKEKAQEKEITIRLRPWKMVKGLMVLLVLLGIFFAGRFSAGGDSSILPDFSSYFSQDAGPSGLVTGDAKEAEEPETIPEAALVEQNETVETQLAESGNVTEAAEEVSNAPEEIVDKEYSKVTLSLDGVYKDWKGTWGKIKGVKYTITNNEAGTIKPHHFAMIVEGYEDGEKHFDVSYTSQRVKAGQSLSDEAAVSGGFAYSAVSIPDGDLSKVRISLFLLDEDSETIAVVHQEVDLSGN